MTLKIVILSARAANLVPCIRAILSNEPGFPSENILVVDDGARPEAESQLPPITWIAGIRPFVFARNANLGLQAAGGDAILLNDDASLVTQHGFSRLAELTAGHPELGICSAAIRGQVGNPRQLVTPGAGLRKESRVLAFICVFIPWRTFQAVGPLDERFSGYGFDDNDYCQRVLQQGLQLGIWDGCVVDHSGELKSTFRLRPDFYLQFEKNRRLYYDKWRGKNISVRPSSRAPLPKAVEQQISPSGRKLNLGCCESAEEGFLNCDIFPGDGRAPVDFNHSWPWEDSTVSLVRALDFIEHLPDKIHTMNELWRIVAPGGKIMLAVPTTEGTGAFQDPTHVSFWNRRSFLYFEAGNPYRERFAQNYGIHARFRITHEQTEQTIDGPRLNLTLEVVKP